MSKLIRNPHGDFLNAGYYANVKIETHYWDVPSFWRNGLFPRSGMVAERHGRCFFRHNRNPDLSIEFIQTGSLFYEENGESRPVGAQELYLVHHNADTILRTGPDGYYRKLVLFLGGTLLDVMVESLNLRTCRRLKPENPGLFESRILELFDLLDRKEKGSECLIASRSYDLLLRLAEAFHAERRGYPESVDKALNFIHTEFHRRIMLEDICTAAGVSRSTLVRLFRRFLDIHPSEYLTRRRLKFARGMIAATDIPFKEIAWRSGYNSPYYFSTAFRKRYGLSPRAFRDGNLPLTNSGEDTRRF